MEFSAGWYQVAAAAAFCYCFTPNLGLQKGINPAHRGRKGLAGLLGLLAYGLASLLSFPFFSSLFLFLFVSFQHQCCCRPLYLSFSSSLVPREASTCRLPALFLLYSRLPCELIKALLEPQSSVMRLERKDKLLGLVGFSGMWAFWACSL